MFPNVPWYGCDMTTHPTFDPNGEQPFRPGTPFAVQRAALRIAQAYGTRGLCDPQYIANVVAHELGLGDGMNNFRESVDYPEECSHRWSGDDRPTTESNADCADCQRLHSIQMAYWQQTAGKAKVST